MEHFFSPGIEYTSAHGGGSEQALIPAVYPARVGCRFARFPKLLLPPSDLSARAAFPNRGGRGGGRLEGDSGGGKKKKKRLLSNVAAMLCHFRRKAARRGVAQTTNLSLSLSLDGAWTRASYFCFTPSRVAIRRCHLPGRSSAWRWWRRWPKTRSERRGTTPRRESPAGARALPPRPALP